MNLSSEKLTNAILAVSALGALILLARRELREPTASREYPVLATARQLTSSDWSLVRKAARSLGRNGQSVELVVFVDIECPFCRRFHEAVMAVERELRDEVSIAIVHYPLSQHRFALLGARALECVSPPEQFSALLRELYRGQDSLGTRPWASYAAAAGVADTNAFTACVARTEQLPRVRSGILAAKRIEAEGTPTVVVNGWMLNAPPSKEHLLAILRDVRSGVPVPVAVREAMKASK